MTHVSHIPLRWADFDALGHVNNAAYLTLCEQARIEAFESLDEIDWSAAGPVVVAASLHFRRAITERITARVEITVGTPGRTSIPTTYRITGADGTLYAEAESALVWVDRASGQPIPVPDGLRARLEAA
jgi:acyl-CoA thioester hydrolase